MCPMRIFLSCCFLSLASCLTEAQLRADKVFLKQLPSFEHWDVQANKVISGINRSAVAVLYSGRWFGEAGSHFVANHVKHLYGPNMGSHNISSTSPEVNFTSGAYYSTLVPTTPLWSFRSVTKNWAPQWAQNSA